MSVTDQSQNHLGSHYQTMLNENRWIGPDSLKRTPCPYPDVTQLLSYHYLSVGNIPVHNRAPDDFQPRAQLNVAIMTKLKHFLKNALSALIW